MCGKNMKKTFGFTLIEVLIVVAIIGIIGAIAIPSYQSSVQKAHRSDAKSTLLEMGALQEKYYFRENVYITDSADLPLIWNDYPDSNEGYYRVSVTATVNGAACDESQCFTIQADAQGAQLNDTECAVFTLDNTGRRTAENENGDVTTDTCW